VNDSVGANNYSNNVKTQNIKIGTLTIAVLAVAGLILFTPSASK
jgi:hypothetical protein